MRSFPDRLRHTILFEFFGLLGATLGGSWALDKPILSIGALGLMFSVLAMSWNFLFNWLFDLWDQRYRNAAKRGFRVRAVHACLFEAGMLLAGMFMVAWWLDISLWEALVIDIGFAVFFLVYAYVYNWAYDHVFPVPKPDPVQA